MAPPRRLRPSLVKDKHVQYINAATPAFKSSRPTYSDQLSLQGFKFPVMVNTQSSSEAAIDERSSPYATDAPDQNTTSDKVDAAYIEKAPAFNPPPLAGQGAELVPQEVEKRLMRKLDLRIIPWAMWMYLMSFMDRVNIGNARIYGLERDLNIEGTNMYQLSVSILFVTYCVSKDAGRRVELG